MMKTHCKAGLLLLALATAARAAVTLPAVISDHMVLQAGTSPAIWGWANPGESVAISIAGQTQKTVADKDGKWSVRLEKLGIYGSGFIQSFVPIEGIAPVCNVSCQT